MAPPASTELPLPPQINAPVGPPPPVTPPPENYGEYVAAAKKAALGRVDIGRIWTELATADALSRVAKELNTLNTFIGAHDRGEDFEAQEVGLRISDQIRMGIVGGVLDFIQEVMMGSIPEDQREELLTKMFASALDQKARG
jgi:hypothetical protein